ncbi:MAG: carboxypeptidase-like regulatory domain-containing protein [Saprospiraceae bacterium]|nr:carboxypeptidase-like regulatory domain-containing protein [Saprospiraceae bacterium]
MLKKYTFQLTLLFAVAFFVSCHNDVGDINPETETNSQITVPLEFNEIEGDLIGYIYDAENNPVTNVDVSIYSSTTTTNAFGFFSFEDVKLDPQGTFVKAEKSGYLLGSDLVYPNTNGKGTSKIELLRESQDLTFDAATGGVLTISGGGTISFPSSALMRSNGSSYDGTVSATAYTIHADDPHLGSKMAGGLIGIDVEGRHRVLSTFGMVAIELRGFDNQPLRIRSDKSAVLTIPISEELINKIDGDIMAWSFDEVEGLWLETSLASFVGSSFSVSIKKLGFWNIGYDYGVSQVCGKVKFSNELPAKNYTVQIDNNGLPSRIGITDQDGFFCGKIPLGEELRLEVLHPVCGTVLKELFIGPFEDIGTIGDIVIDIDEDYISGKIECNGEGINTATIMTNSGGIRNIFFPNANGSFSINLGEISCNSSNPFTLVVFDDKLSLSSDIYELSADFSESLEIEICQVECTASSEFVYEKEDYCIDGDYNRVSVDIEGGSGEYSYIWQNGSTDIYLNDLMSGSEVCVEVTDIVTECTYTFCDQVEVYKRLRIDNIYSSNDECFKNSGFIEMSFEGGKAPFSFEWTGPAGFFSQNEKIEDLIPGSYDIKIIDSGDCEVSESIEVYDVTTPIQSSKEDFCDLSIITIAELDGYKPYTYTWDAGEALGNQLFVYDPGVYNLTMTDANNCMRSTSLTISKAGSLPDIDISLSCEGGVITFSNLPSGFDYFYIPSDSEDKIPVNLSQGKLNLEIIETGYRFDLGSENPIFSNCFTTESVELPHFEGLKNISTTSVSCDVCADGKIEYTIDDGEVCESCTPGEARVLSAENMNDVTAINEAGELTKGEYYVVVLDENNACYIAHSLVVLD